MLKIKGNSIYKKSNWIKDQDWQGKSSILPVNSNDEETKADDF